MKSVWDDLKGRLTSRKLWVAVVSAVSVVLVNTFGLDAESASLITWGIIIIAVAYITDESLVDAVREVYRPRKEEEDNGG